MPINSRAKGKRFELTVAHLLTEQGFPCERGQQHKGGSDSPDVVGLPGIHIEAKNVQRLNIFDAMHQAIRDTGASGNLPAVFHKKDREEILVTMRESDWILLYQAWDAARKDNE